MRLFNKIFGKASSNKKVKQKNKKGDLDGYSLQNITISEKETIKGYTDYISMILNLNCLSNVNQNQLLHPDNLTRFANEWFNTDKKSRIHDAEESMMVLYLGASLGQYLEETYDLDWCNAGDLNNPTDSGDIYVECALVNRSQNILFFPFKVMAKEIQSGGGHLANELLKLSKRIEPSQSNDSLSFEELVSSVKESGKGEDVLKIWEKVLNLEKWHFITAYNNELEPSKPFIGVVHNKPWFFVFTDGTKALEYAKSDSRFLGPDGGTFIISQSVESSLQMIRDSEQHGVFGLKVNSGDDKINADFNIPITVLKQIIQVLNK